MKILFVNPSRSGHGFVPVNIPLLTAVLRKEGHEVKLFDFSSYAVFDASHRSYESRFFKKAEIKDDGAGKEREEFFLKEYNRKVNGLELLNTDYHVDFGNLLKEFKPDLVAVSVLSIDFRFASGFILPFKQVMKFKTVFGGIHSILMPEETIASPACDIVCIGEGENAFPLLLKAMEEGKPLTLVKGFWFKQAGHIIKNPPTKLTDITTLPFLDFDGIDPIHFYRPFVGKKWRMLNYEVTRGCPYSCSYCVNSTLKQTYAGLGTYFRKKSVDRTIEEIVWLKKKHGFNFIRFWDEDFTAKTEGFLHELADRYVEEVNLPFLIFSRAESVTEQKVIDLKRMGCKAFAMGIESGSEFIRRKVMNRQVSNETIVKKFNLVNSYGVRTSAYNILGNPYETRDMIFETIELNRLAKPTSFSANLLEPYKGTPIRKMCEDEGLDKDYEPFFYGTGEPHFVPRGMTAEDLSGLFRVFAFYVRLPKERRADIEKAEKDDKMFEKINKEHDEFLQKAKNV